MGEVGDEEIDPSTLAVQYSTSTLKGHKSDVLTLDILPQSATFPPLLASGSEDSTVRLWDMDKHQAIRCFHGMFDDEPVGAVAFLDEARLFAANSQSVVELDPRSPRIVVTETKAHLPFIAHDEINQLAIHPKTKGYLAVADDSGRLTLLDTSTSPPRPYRVLSCPSRDDMCTSVQFRPKVNWDVACGFHQFAIGLWDFSRARCRTIEMGNADEASAEEDEGEGEGSPSASRGSQMFNPPYVNSLAFSSDGRYLVAGRGDGEVGVYEYSTGRQVRALRGGHSTAIAHACVVGGGGGKEELLIASAGNDRVLCLWQCENLGAKGKGGGSAAGGGRRNDRAAAAGEEGGGKGARAPSRSKKDGNIRLLQRMNLPSKPNYMTRYGGEGGEEPIRIFVAGTSPEISVFSFPAP